MEEDRPEQDVFATFNRFEEFDSIQTKLLQACKVDQTTDDSNDATFLLNKLISILAEYQEQAYLLDPFLERLISPVAEQLKSIISKATSEKASECINLIATLFYHYINFRGHKAITRFFPHEIADLSIALDFLLLPGGPAQDAHQWHLRYVMLLWLSLICMLPFDLAQFDDPQTVGKTASSLEGVAKSYLDKAGVERSAAAILLSRLYARKDTNSKLPAFLQWTGDVVKNPNELFSSIGALQVLCELAKSAPADQFYPYTAELFGIVHAIDSNTVLTSNMLVRKLRIKLSSRILLRLLPARRRKNRIRARALRPGATVDDESQDEENFDIPDEVETVLEDTFKALQDKDTVVRYSAAKAVARIAERLPTEFSEQVLDTVLQLFSVHSMGAATMYDLPSIAEATWHGACLASAEMARRSLVPDNRLRDLIGWMRNALYFDIRKGAHSVGASVRDAASYVLWSLARAQGIQSLSPFANDLAQTLVTASIFDREVHIRRAASAAFQEFVGRTSLFPHGIDVLRKTDFYAVGTRRNAFLVVAPEVAEHDIYQPHLMNHLLTTTMRHWDPAMRRLGAESVRAICQLDLWSLADNCIKHVTPYLSFTDTSDIHGALLTLIELAKAFEHAEPGEGALAKRQEIFTLLNKVPQKIVQSHRNELITTAACQLIAHSISLPEIQLQSRSSVPHWRSLIDFALRSNSIPIQEAAAEAMASVSRFIHESKSGSPALQQSVCRVLGVLDYNLYPAALQNVIGFLIDSVDRTANTALQNVEARRNVYNSLPQIISNILPRLEELLTAQALRDIFSSLLAGLADYSLDERGDVGSWIRISCVRGITDIAVTLLSDVSLRPRLVEYFPAAKFHEGVAGILKQGVERLDNVRQQAGEQLSRLLLLSDVPDDWRIHGADLMRELFLSDKEATGWNEGSWLFPRVVKLLQIPQYRHAILAGLVMSAGSKTDSTQRPVSTSLVSYARTLPARGDGTGYDLRGLATDLLAQAKQNLASNNVVIPVLQTFNVLLEADAFEELGDDQIGLQTLQSLLSICSRNVSRLKNMQRIATSMRIVVNMLGTPPLRDASATQLPSFLAHQFPKIRTDTAECLYLVLQSKDIGIETDTAEDIILGTEWSSDSIDVIREAAERCAQLLTGLSQ